MQKTRSGLFLMELIFAILIFSLCSVICLQLFVTARNTGDSALEKTKAVTLCADAAELFYGFDGSLPKMLQVLDIGGRSQTNGQEVILYYDRDFNQSAKAGGIYALKLQTSSQGDLIKGYFSFVRLSDDTLIYDLDTSLFTMAVSANAADGISSGSLDDVYSGVPGDTPGTASPEGEATMFSPEADTAVPEDSSASPEGETAAPGEGEPAMGGVL